jgi:hypothetical protein
MQKKHVFLFCLLAVPLFGQQPQSPAPGRDDAGDSIPLAEVVKQVTSAIQEYESSVPVGENSLPSLSSAVFDFKTVTKKSIGGSIQVLVFKFGASRENDVTNEVTFTYKPKPVRETPKLFDKSRHPPTPPPLFKDELAQTIQSAAKAIKDAGSVADLPLDQLTVNLQFGVTWDIGPGGQATISIVTVGLSGDINKNTVQSVKLVFGRES